MRAAFGVGWAVLGIAWLVLGYNWYLALRDLPPAAVLMTAAVVIVSGSCFFAALMELVGEHER
jgi:exosortase/archaeosortase